MNGFYEQNSDVQGFTDIVYGIFKSLLSFEIYSTLGVGQWIMIGSFLIFSTTLYKITDIIVSRYLNITMFNIGLMIDKMVTCLN